MNEKDMELKEKLADLKDWQLSLLTEYCEDDMKKIKRIVNKCAKGLNLPYSDYDFLYGEAEDKLLESVVSFDCSKGAKFKTFLTGNIGRSVATWYRDNYQRSKRRNLAKDQNGKILFDEEENPTIIPDISFDTSCLDDEGIELKEKIASDFDVEGEVLYERYPENVRNYLSLLGKVEREIAVLIINNFDNDEIKEKLGLTDREFSMYLSDMKKFNKKRVLKNNENEDNSNTKTEEEPMEVLTSTSENKKDTSYSLAAIIKKLTKNQIRDNHVLQRSSGQWKAIAKSELVSDILQGNSLTPIIISEEIKNGIPMHWLIDGKQRCTNIHEFFEDGFAISKNVQIYNIQYITEKLDENGNVIFNEDGFPIPEIKTFDIRNKKFSQLPDELKDKFLEYQLPVMMNLNCTKKKIAYDIARFNRCRPMNVAQNGWTGLEEIFAEYVDNILKMDFFKIDCDKSNYTNGNDKSGAMRRMIVEAIITSRYIDKFNKDFRKMCEYLSEEASESVFIDFYTSIDRLSNAVTEKTSKLFNTKNSFLWFALFERFTTYGLPDERFGEFLDEFVDSLKDKKYNGTTYADLDKDRTTKDKNVVKEKMKHLTYLMEEYLHIETKNDECIENESNVTESQDKNESVIDFVRNNVSQDITEDDIECFESTFDDLTYEVDEKSKLLESANIKSMIALVAYSYQKDTDLEEWIVDFFSRNNTYIQDQKENYTYMVNDLNNFMGSKENNTVTAA